MKFSIYHFLSLAQRGFTPLEAASPRSFGLAAKNRARVLAGFTMVEIVVMLAIIVLISSVLLANFPGFNEVGALLRARQELALDFRRLQNYALAVSNVQLENGSPGAKPRGVCAHFNRAFPNGYLLFVDSETGGTPNQYDSGDGIISQVNFLRDVKLNSFSVDSSCGPTDYTKLDVVFKSPEARMTISADGVNIMSCTNLAVVEIKTPNLNLARTVSVWITGYIGTEYGLTR